MKSLRISDWVFFGLALTIALAGVFASEYCYGDYQIGALAAAIIVVVLWIIYDALTGVARKGGNNETKKLL